MILEGDIPEHSAQNGFWSSLVEALREVPVGFAQVMLQPSRLVGIAFLIGALWNSWILASFGVLGCIAGIATALALDYPAEERRGGLYGFNGALVGLGCSYFYEPSLPLAAFVAVGGAASSIVMHALLLRGLKPLTFPFVVVTWIIFGCVSVSGWASATPVSGSVPQEVIPVHALSRGVGQVLFQESIITGAIFFVAIILRDRIQGVYVALATIMGLIGGSVLGFPVDAVNLGLFGYNGVLCGILFAGSRFSDMVSAVGAILLSIVIVRLFHVVELPAFTFPFVVSSWLVLWARGCILTRASQI